MVTFTLPEWVAWVLVYIAFIYTFNMVLFCYQIYLNWQIRKQRQVDAELVKKEGI